MNRSSQLMNKASQGKVLKLVSLSPSSSHFMSDGSYTRFADWRFIHRARLNQVHLNGCQPWMTDVACPFEGSDTAFTNSYESKVSKYDPLIPLYRAQGLNAIIVPILVGALGSWCPWNDRFLKNLQQVIPCTF
ncbi:retrovirus-related Pol polyprotein from type-1 retrotransposable element R2 [Caerostris extrusa]|uniref:Retrovirus-related Pol polyprotein from type-1 retrotransposable element R2 n=1 Tax=Caerostris extrusa TaxID=172846 RepID=A0AAV4X4E2_CAEEX|nr:retrovirus-related Pol polyprotein from type-1 retrotransposable element R2 [Caerostris extrusa]